MKKEGIAMELDNKDWGSFRDIREIWAAIDKEYRDFPEKYSVGKKRIEE